MVVTYVC